MPDAQARTLNLFGAVVLGVHDELSAAVVEATGRDGTIAAALAVVAQFEGVSVSDLRRFLGLSHPATVRVVNVLESEGLARREVDGLDRRTTHVRLTDDGHDESRRVLQVRHAVLGRLLDDGDGDALDGLLERMLTRLAEGSSRSYELCRLCDISTCPQSRCPVETACRSAGTTV